MAEENQVMKEPQGEAAQAQQITKEPQRVTTKNPNKVEAGKGWLRAIVRREKRRKRRTIEIGEKWRKPILWNWGCLSSGSYRRYWLLHLSNQESRATTTK